MQAVFGPHLDSRTPGQRLVPGRHSPVIALRRGLFALGKWTADHDRVCTGGERLTYITTRADTTVSDDRNVLSRLL